MTEPKPTYDAGQSLRFWAEIIRVQTMADGAIRVVLEAPENETVLLAQLAECRRRGAVLEIVATPKVGGDLTDLDDETEKGAERETTRTGRRRLGN